MKLENWGYESPVAFTSQDAIKQFHDTDPDLIIMDITLKGKLNGIETAELIDSELKTPIIYYSSKNDEELSQKIKKLQNRDYITKASGDNKLKLSIQKSLEKNFLEIEETKITNNETLSGKVKPQIKDIMVTQGDERVNGNISSDEKDKIIEKVDRFKNNGYLKIKPVGDNLKPAIENKDEEYTSKESFISGALNATKTINNATDVSTGYHQAQQIIEQELQNLEKHFTKVYDKSSSQDKEINNLKKSLDDYIKLVMDKENKIRKMEKTQKKLEEDVLTYKNQHQTVLDEMYRLKNQINKFITNLDE
jgi:CheY-like chemotaxis protein